MLGLIQSVWNRFIYPGNGVGSIRFLFFICKSGMFVLVVGFIGPGTCSACVTKAKEGSFGLNTGEKASQAQAHCPGTDTEWRNEPKKIKRGQFGMNMREQGSAWTIRSSGKSSE